MSALGFKDWTSCTIDRSRNVVSAFGTDAVEPMATFNIWANGSVVPMVVTSIMSGGAGVEWEAIDRATFLRRYAQYCRAELGIYEERFRCLLPEGHGGLHHSGSYGDLPSGWIREVNWDDDGAFTDEKRSMPMQAPPRDSRVKDEG